MATESDLNRYRTDAVRLRNEIAKASASVAASRKKANDARTAIGRTKNQSTINSKLRDVERAERDAAAGEKKRSDLEKKLADVEGKIAKAQVDVDKKRLADQKKAQAEQKRALDNLKRQNDQAAAQFRLGPPRRLGDKPPSAMSLTRVSPASDLTPNDVFLSHASEDKDAIARPLKDALEARGVSVWFDEIKIKVGQSIRQEIEKGIAHARFGVVILSPDFFKKHWTQAELDALFSRKMDSGENMILPIWHKVTKDEVMAQSPLLAGILALNSSLMTVDEMADQLAEVVRP